MGLYRIWTRVYANSVLCLLVAIGFIVLTLQNADAIVRGLMFCFITNTVIIILITRYWKISIHAMGVAGLIAALWVNGGQSPLIMGFILVLVASARVVLKAHNISQVIVGSFLGMILTYIQLHLIFI